MLIWKGPGLMIPIFTFVSLWGTKFIFDESLFGSKLHYGVAIIVAGLVLLLFKKMKERQKKKVLESGNEEKIAQYNAMFENNPMMDYDNASFFFIPFMYWQYIMFALGLSLLIAHLFTM